MDIFCIPTYIFAEGCCETFNIETVGGGNFYQEECLGAIISKLRILKMVEMFIDNKMGQLPVR